MRRVVRPRLRMMIACMLLGGGMGLSGLVAAPVSAEPHEQRVLKKQMAQPVRSAADVRCVVPKAPVIQVLPKSAAIRYDYSQTAEQLTARGSNTVNPYAANVDSTTGGMRVDNARISSHIKMGTQTYPSLKVGCIWYDSITVNISLSPVIYIAKEYQQEPCRSGITEHELKHVSVDREVMNKFSREIGLSVQEAVNQAGAFGPFNAQEMPEHQERLIQHIKSAVDSRQLMLEKEMRTRQGQVDSLEEYKRVSKICHGVMKKTRS